MSDILRVNGQPAFKIFAECVTETAAAYLLDCEGDEIRFPKSTVVLNDDGTALVTESMYNIKFGDE